ncbi:MAG: hypothetical protein ACFFCT_13525 [Candidatus Odinarchaeota archaeon]
MTIDMTILQKEMKLRLCNRLSFFEAKFPVVFSDTLVIRKVANISIPTTDHKTSRITIRSSHATALVLVYYELRGIRVSLRSAI